MSDPASLIHLPETARLYLEHAIAAGAKLTSQVPQDYQLIYRYNQ